MTEEERKMVLRTQARVLKLETDIEKLRKDDDRQRVVIMKLILRIQGFETKRILQASDKEILAEAQEKYGDAEREAARLRKLVSDAVKRAEMQRKGLKSNDLEKSFDQLAKEQGVKPLNDLSKIKGESPLGEVDGYHE